MTLQPPAIPSPTCILNGHSVHVEEAKAHIARISGEVAVQVQVVVTKRGDDISALVARARASAVTRSWPEGVTGPSMQWPASSQAPIHRSVFCRWVR